MLMSRITEVRAYPCDPTSDDYKTGPTFTDNRGGIGGGGYKVKSSSVMVEGINWRVAIDDNAGILWVLCPSRETVESHRGSLERYIGRTLQTAKAMPKPSSKRLALNAITQAVADAVAHGVTPQEIRLAVFSAMGLDADAA